MIEINMLKQKPVVHGVPSGKDGAKLLLVVLASFFIGGLLTVGIWKVSKGILGGNGETESYVNVADPVSEPVVSSQVVTEELKDSVKDIPAKVKSSTEYADMSMQERLNYEHIYAYYLFRELSLIVPGDVDFTSLGFSEFKKVHGEGGVDSEKGVTDLFSSLKTDGWKLEPKPRSLFRSFVDGYQFIFNGGYYVTPDSLDVGLLTLSDIPAAAHLQRLKDSVSTIIKNEPVSVLEPLTNLNTEFEGKYRHYLYTVKGRSSFHQFLNMLRQMKLSKLPVSVSSAELKAHDEGLNWVITVKVTVM